jgi:hypothetical protein
MQTPVLRHSMSRRSVDLEAPRPVDISGSVASENTRSQGVT